MRHAVVGERDRIVTLFSRDGGKFSAVAKGARRPGSTLGPCVDMLTYGRFHCVRRRGLDLITQATPLDSFTTMKADLWQMSCGLYICELIDCSNAEGVPNSPLFEFLISVLKNIDSAGCDDLVLRVFELRLLDYLGFCPSLNKCVTCGSVLQPVENALSASLGGALCPECANRCPDAKPLSVDALKVMRFWLGCTLDSARRVKLDQLLAYELEEHVLRFIQGVVQRDIKSREWLVRLKSEALLTRTAELSTIPRRIESE
ncbi:MAG: DNA repair protein RecO [Dehalococcoidia bacterium]|nr:DNA repair protein RecO [Dehalococcoidia bacterium]